MAKSRSRVAACAYRPLLIRASAGTGKTYRLAHRYLELLAHDEPPGEIMAATFARKAAGEIAQRILLRLAEGVQSETVRAALAKEMGLAELSEARCRSLLSLLIRQLHQLRIGTLDRFFLQVAATHGLELDLPAGWRILDDREDEQLRELAIQRLLAAEPDRAMKLFYLLNPGESVQSVARQLLTEVQSMYDLFRQTSIEAWKQLQPHSVLDAAERVAACDQLKASPLPADKRWATAHEKNCAAAQAENWEEFLTNGLSTAIRAGRSYYAKMASEALSAAYRPLLDHARGEFLNRLMRQLDGTYQLLHAFDLYYQELKREERGQRFDDLPWLLNLALRDGKVGDGAHRLGGRIRHLLLDEFQDTSISQWSVLRPLAQRCLEQGSLFCVGDGKQAIYGWRGGVAEIFEALEAELPAVQSEPLDKSYRSCPVLIETVNRLFSTLVTNPVLSELQTPAQAWQRRFQTHATHRGELKGEVALWIADPPQPDEKKNHPAMRKGAELVRQLYHDHPTRSIALLVRTNAAVAGLIYLLQRLGIPASEEGGVPLNDSPAVQVILSLLHLADHPGDTTARYHLAHSPLAAALQLSDFRDEARATALSLALREQLFVQGYGETIRHWVNQFAEQCDDRDQNRLAKLVDLAFAYEEKATPRTYDFIDTVAKTRVEDPSAARVRVMTIHQAKGLQFDIVVLPELWTRLAGQTPRYHVERAAPTAPITGVIRHCDEKLAAYLPDRFRELIERWREPLVSESLAVLYVAMTRAVHALHLIVPQGTINAKQVQSRTFGGMLLAALAPDATAASQGKVFAAGDAAWDDSIQQRSQTAPPAAPPVAVRLRPSDSRHLRLRPQAPSNLEGASRVNLAERVQMSQRTAAQRGSLWHLWLSEIEWLEQGPVDAHLIARAQQAGLAGPEVPHWLRQFRTVLSKPHLRQVLTESDYLSRAADVVPPMIQSLGGSLTVEILRERRFALRRDGALVSGVIDRLALWKQAGKVVAAEVIDFKSDQLADEQNLTDRVEFYRPQLVAYCQAVAQLYHLPADRVAGRLLFLMSDRSVWLAP